MIILSLLVSVGISAETRVFDESEQVALELNHKETVFAAEHVLRRQCAAEDSPGWLKSTLCARDLNRLISKPQQVTAALEQRCQRLMIQYAKTSDQEEKVALEAELIATATAELVVKNLIRAHNGEPIVPNVTLVFQLGPESQKSIVIDAPHEPPTEDATDTEEASP